jgi:hypothetical protein
MQTQTNPATVIAISSVQTGVRDSGQFEIMSAQFDTEPSRFGLDSADRFVPG